MMTVAVARARPRMDPDRAALCVFVAVSASLLAISATAAIAHHGSMIGMGAMPMAGGWTLSPVWTLMCGSTWPMAAASFLGMWAVMMTAMMLPALMPSLWRYHHALRGASPTRRAALVLLAGAAYFAVWFALGLALFPPGAAIAALLIEWPAMARAAPLMTGLVLLAAGALQWTTWKSRHLRHCRAAPAMAAGSATAWMTACRYGLRLGMHCNLSCAGLTAGLLTLGVMDAGVMAIVTVAVTIERLAPAAVRCARVIGVVMGGLGVCMIASGLFSVGISLHRI